MVVPDFFFSYWKILNFICLSGGIKISEEEEHQGVYGDSGQHAESDSLYYMVWGLTDAAGQP